MTGFLKISSAAISIKHILILWILNYEFKVFPVIHKLKKTGLRKMGKIKCSYFSVFYSRSVFKFSSAIFIAQK